MSRSRIVLCLVALAPGMAHAQAPVSAPAPSALVAPAVLVGGINGSINGPSAWIIVPLDRDTAGGLVLEGGGGRGGFSLGVGAGGFLMKDNAPITNGGANLAFTFGRTSATPTKGEPHTNWVGGELSVVASLFRGAAGVSFRRGGRAFTWSVGLVVPFPW